MFTHVLDLTHTIREQTPTYDDGENFIARTVATREKHGYFAREICLPEHYGTHLDAPAHMAAGGWTVDEIPAERLARPLVVIDVSAKTEADADYRISVDDFAAWEGVRGYLPEGAVVLVHTGWDQRWHSPQAYRNSDALGAMHFPGYSVEAAKFLVEARAAIGIGIDTLSVDAGIAVGFPVHHFCAARSVYHLENLANLTAAPAAGAMVIVAPAKLAGGSGAPARVLALVP